MNEPIARAMAKHISQGNMAGAVTLIWRNGRLVHKASQGQRNLAAGLPMESDTLFRVASLTKPVTSVAAMMLVEEKRIALDDPISRWVPEFSTLNVLRAIDGPCDDVEPAQQEITVEDLLTHRAGFTYGDFHTGPIAAAYAEALGASIDSEHSPDSWMARLASLPLVAQPGAGFHYGHSTDLLGFLLARIEGMPLQDLLRRRIFEPLGMVDTDFTVSVAKRHRCAAPLGFSADGRPAQRAMVPAGHALQERPVGMSYVSGGQGLWSTADDYLAFARVFVEGGAVDGVRLLQPETVHRMMTNRLSPAQRDEARMFGLPIFATGHGFGLGVAVVVEPDKAVPTLCGGGVGAIGWPGAYGGWWQADPNDSSVAIFLTHNMVDADQMASGVGLGVYAAISDFQAMAPMAD